MAGSSQRRGAIRKTGSKKGQVVGTGGQKSKRLKPKGPTPKATERTKHPAARKAAASARRSAASTTGRSGGRGPRRTGGLASGHPGHDDVRREPDRLRRPGP
jgi:23S rRNA (guanosine2251-2'-O)-methyltransferase